jgi:hypothetical protein
MDSEKAEFKAPLPQLHLEDVPELHELPDGMFTFVGTGMLKRHTESVDDDGEKHCSCDIEIHSIEPKGDEKAATDLGKSLDKISKKKQEPDEDDE